jgi:SPP1 gp7 family putative phage head morphogenesis protein
VKTLKPQPLRESDYDDVRRQLEKIFYAIIFKPLVDLLSPHNKQVRTAASELKNAIEDPIVTGIRSGQIQYSNGVFSGQFNSRISRALKSIGAKFSKTTKVFTLAPDLVPPAVRAAAHSYEQTARKLHDSAMKALDGVEGDLERLVDVHVVDAGTMVSNVQKGFAKSVGDALGNKELSDESRARLKKEYTDSLKPWIKKFSAETIGELREQIEANALTGYRFDHLVNRVQSRYDVSRSKAEFLARQETALYVSRHREVRFAESGITQYVWRTAGGPRVREDHRKLEGRVFSYAHPPVVDEATNRRANPGGDFNCRCVDEPVLPPILQTQSAERKNSLSTPQLQECNP